VKAIDKFTGDYDFLSNFYPATIEVEETVFPSVEHAYQAMKSKDPEERERIRACKTAGDAKRAGQKVSLRPEWEEIKVQVMKTLLMLKFMDNPDLAERLLATGNAELIEGNHWGDRVWGVYKGEGQNLLGRLLMKTRDLLSEPMTTMEALS